MPTTNDELIRAINRLVEQQAAARETDQEQDRKDFKRWSANERLLVQVVREFNAFKVETTARLDRKGRRIYWLGIGLMLVSFLFFVMVIASLFQ